MKHNARISLYNFINTGLLCMGLYTTSHASIIINEVDYDQPGIDTAEFIELYNTGLIGSSLDGFTLSLINGLNGIANSLDLSSHFIAAGDYFVLCDNVSNVANCDVDIGSNNWIQNGGSDGEGIALYDNSVLVDSLVYEYNNVDTLGAFAEGNTSAGSDPSSNIASLSRIPNGLDSNINSDDFTLGCITPGSVNITGSGDCSITMSPVPLPAAVWLFGSGLLGLLGVARRKRD